MCAGLSVLQLVLMVYDSTYQDNVDYAVVSIDMLRNLNRPVFSKTQYETRILETQELNAVFFSDIHATDNDSVMFLQYFLLFFITRCNNKA